MTRIRWTDLALAGVVTAGICWEVSRTFTPTLGHALTAVLLAATGVALAWRRVAPVHVAVLAAVAFCAPAVFGPPVENASYAVAYFVISYSAVAYAPDSRTALLSGAILLAGGSLYSWVVWPGVVNLLFAWIQIGVAFGIGAVMRRVRHTAAVSQQRAELAELVREQHAAAAVAAERARIARDLHDVVAHAISVIVLQARGGRRMLAIDPVESRAAFDTVEQVGEHALTDMRRMLGVLRADDGADLAPQPSLRHLDALIAQLSRPGLTMVSDVVGDVDGLPAGVDLAAYRIVQESLTNVVRHAGASTVSVVVRIDSAALRIEVCDDGTGSPATEPGFGILGMRERVALYGGTLDVGAEPAGGYRVRACLPVPA
jgi:signal transduction histidine kinase